MNDDLDDLLSSPANPKDAKLFPKGMHIHCKYYVHLDLNILHEF